MAETKHTCISVVQSSSLGPLEKIWLQRLYSNQSRETKKLKLVLDLDHTLMNSTNLSDLAADESHVLGHISVKKGTFHLLMFPIMGMGVVPCNHGACSILCLMGMHYTGALWVCITWVVGPFFTRLFNFVSYIRQHELFRMIVICQR